MCIRDRVGELSNDLSCTASAWPPTGITKLFPFTDGITGNNIADGGDDLYDVGNIITVCSFSAGCSGIGLQALPYKDECSGPVNHTAIGDVVYSTCKQTNGLSASPLFIASFRSPSADIRAVRFTGNTGCDGSGTATGSSLMSHTLSLIHI